MSRYDKALYDWYKENRICPNCGRREAAPGRVRCYECLEMNAQSRRKKDRCMTPEYARRKRHERQEQIIDRKGKMIDGVFVKEEDLK